MVLTPYIPIRTVSDAIILQSAFFVRDSVEVCIVRM